MTLSDGLEKLRTRTTPRNCQFETKLNLWLNYVKEHPHEIRFVGVTEIGPNIIRINSAILAVFLRLKQNTVNRNFRRAGYIESSSQSGRSFSIPGLLEEKGWSTRIRLDGAQD
jgi:hypothetical protein